MVAVINDERSAQIETNVDDAVSSGREGMLVHVDRILNRSAIYVVGGL